MDVAAFARLRPLMPLQALIEAAGDQWDPDADLVASEGHLSFGGEGDDLIGGAQIDLQRRIGSLSFFRKFPAGHPVEGLVPGMTFEAALQAQPGLTQVEDADSAQYGIQSYEAGTASGDRLKARFKNGVLLRFDIERPGLCYPERPYRRADPSLTTAYDLYCGGQRPLPETDRDPAAWRNGWCLGRPPGIATAQWPLCPRTAQPLRHVFTLMLPEQYRAQGPEFPALCLFVGPMHFAAEPVPDPAPEPRPHPRKFAMSDALDTPFAALWLSREEFKGPLAQPPAVASGVSVPGWLHQGYPESLGESYSRPRDREGRPHDWLPGRGLETAFPIGILEREGDPNVGKPAREWEHENEDSGYAPAFSEQGQGLGLERYHGVLAHLGGTMFPQQGYPPFSPRYLEFDEGFGMCNFGGGNAQLDLDQMKIDWACG